MPTDESELQQAANVMLNELVTMDGAWLRPLLRDHGSIFTKDEFAAALINLSAKVDLVHGMALGLLSRLDAAKPAAPAAPAPPAKPVVAKLLSDPPEDWQSGTLPGPGRD